MHRQSDRPGKQGTRRRGGPPDEVKNSLNTHNRVSVGQAQKSRGEITDRDQKQSIELVSSSQRVVREFAGCALKREKALDFSPVARCDSGNAHHKEIGRGCRLADDPFPRDFSGICLVFADQEEERRANV
jgi:hypothetical protein